MKQITLNIWDHCLYQNWSQMFFIFIAVRIYLKILLESHLSPSKFV